MGEEEKKPEGEKKPEEPKPKVEEEKPKSEEEKPKAEEKKEGEAVEPPPPPPEVIEMRVFMHCEGCARKVKRCLKGFDGVEEVSTDCKTHKVVVKGKKAAEDPLKVVERVQKKSGRKVELLTPLPPPKVEEKKEEEKKEEEKPKVEEKKEEPPVIAVVMKVHMHCDACAQEIKKRILKMKGVQSVDPDLKASQVTVKGVMDPQKLVEYVYKRTGKHAAVVKSEPVDKKPEDGENKPKENDEKLKENEEKKPEEAKPDAAVAPDAGGDGKEKKEGGGGLPEDAATTGAAAKVEAKKNEFYYCYPKFQFETAYPPPAVAYPPQLFSDENPNACSVM